MSTLLETIDRIRREVCELHAELTRYQLVVWTAGNVSARVPGYDLMVIKPSGVSYDDLPPGPGEPICPGKPSSPGEPMCPGKAPGGAIRDCRRRRTPRRTRMSTGTCRKWAGWCTPTPPTPPPGLPGGKRSPAC